MNKNNLILKISNYFKAKDEFKILVLNGSMADPNVIQDEFQDIDFSLLTSSVTKASEEIQSYNLFHNSILLTAENDIKTVHHSSIRILMESGVEIGFNIYDNFELFSKEINKYVVLLFNTSNEKIDFSPPKNRPFHVDKPPEVEFAQLIFDIYWAVVDVNKGVKRNHFIYAKHKFDTILQPKMKKLITWYVRDLNDWNVSLGAQGKRIKEYLEPNLYMDYLATYSGNSVKDIFKSLVNSIGFVEDIGCRLAKSLGYKFPSEVGIRIRAYLNKN